MSNLIDRDIIVKNLKKEIQKCSHRTLMFGYEVVDMLMNAPTVDAEPIVHAYWEKWTVDIAPHPWHCSKCGFSDHHSPHMDEYCRCPNCGAKMDEGVIT